MAYQKLHLSPRLLATLSALLCVCGSTFAATDWSASFGGCTSGSTATAWSNIECAVETGGIDTNVAGVAWKYSNNSTIPSPTSTTAITGLTASNAGTVISWGAGGLGVLAPNDTNTSPSHAVDNGNQYIDSLVLQFSESVSMNALSIGWKGSDSDISIFAWTGAAPTSTPAPTSLTGGWTSVAQLSNVAANSPIQFVNTAYNSSYWLVAALGTDASMDAFKLLSVAGSFASPSSNGVPEPGSLALLGLGAAGLLAARRRSLAIR